MDKIFIVSSHSRPNILIIMSDQHQREIMGCAGNSIIRTPHMDRLAAEGMRFTNAYCPSPLSGPSRMSFLTGRTPSDNGCLGNGAILSSAIPTWAHALGAAGYETALIGRMDIRGPDQRHGFELRPMGDYNALHPGAPHPGGPLGKKIPDGAGQGFGSSVRIAGHGTTHRHHFDDHVTESACNFLLQRGHKKNSRPFAAVAGFWLPHPPFIAPRDLFEYYHPKVPIPSMPIESETALQPLSIQNWRKSCGFLEPITNEQLRNAVAAYYGLTEYVDRQMGRILQVLDETGLSRETLVIYTSDHGEMLGAHGCWAKNCYYEQSVTVPFIARLPGLIPPGTTCPATLNLMDLAPTLTEIAGAKSMSPVEGRSILPCLKNEKASHGIDETFSEVVDKKTGLASAMIRSGPWKLWKYHGPFPPSLFNLESDPQEKNDLGTSTGHEEIRDRLLKRLFEKWNPEKALKTFQQHQNDIESLKAWGRAVKPSHPDTFPIPPPEIEDDVILL